MKALFKFFSSLQLTTILLSLSMALVFFGTLDQVNYGIWHTQKLYFESFLVIWSYPQEFPLYDQLFWLRIPMPGGYLLGGLLFINLIAAHVTRFKLTFKKSGIFLVHFGLVLLLVSELLTDIVSEESQMPVDEGGRNNYSETTRDNELVFVDRTHPDHDMVHSIPVDLLKPGKVMEVPESPLSIRTVRYYPNANVGTGQQPDSRNLANRGAAVRMNIFVEPRQKTYAEGEFNAATAYIEVSGPDGVIGTWLVSNLIDERFPPQMVNLGEKSWEIALRFRRYYHPFELELIDFSHEKYPGTEIPFNFSSEVMIHHTDSTKNQKSLIYMNHPLRYEGLTFYQASFANQDKTSIFQVVKNPGWILPYVSVLLMGLGMCVQFGMHFQRFLSRKT
ncbi:MAG: cytochrome c biogenesis protein ResB [Verrucomicrobiota bacterium]